MDVLADVLAVTRLTNSTLCSAVFVAPWGLVFDPSHRATFHMVSRGRCWLMPGDGLDPVALNQGDVALLTHGKGHVLADRTDTLLAHYQHYGGVRSAPTNAVGETATLFCGGFYFEQNGVNPIISLLPPVVHLPADDIRAVPDLQDVAHLLMRESGNPAPGSDTVVARLMDVLFVYVVRAWVKAQPERAAGWVGALRDPQIGRALAFMHESPHRSWTVDSLAQSVAMSRAAFSKRFSSLVGEAPLTYLRRWRMDLAARLLRGSEQSVGAVANHVGYESETTFSRMFRRSRGMAPGQYRHRQRVP